MLPKLKVAISGFKAGMICNRSSKDIVAFPPVVGLTTTSLRARISSKISGGSKWPLAGITWSRSRWTRSVVASAETPQDRVWDMTYGPEQPKMIALRCVNNSASMPALLA